MKKLVGLVLILIGIVLGIWLGIFVCFIGGILEFFQGLQPVNTTHIAWGLIKFFLSGLVGWGIFGLCTVIGAVMLD